MKRNYLLWCMCALVALIVIGFAIDWIHAVYMATDTNTTWQGVSVAQGASGYWFPWGAVSKNAIIAFFAVSMVVSFIGEMLTKSDSNTTGDSNNTTGDSSDKK